MKSLIGFFDLDPSRVFDLLLDAFQQQPKNIIYARFIHNFSPRVIAQTLGFRFQLAHVRAFAACNSTQCLTLESLRI